MAEGRRIVVNLEQPSTGAAGNNAGAAKSAFSPSLAVSPASSPKKRRGLFKKILLGLGALILLFVIGGAIAGYLWYRSVEQSPAYSLALLIDAARKDDAAAVETLLDTNAVVDDFMPQVTAKATERYGRGLPPATVARATAIFQPILQQMLPQIKDAARQRIPQIIKERAKTAPQYSPFVMAAGIRQAAEITQNGDTATVKASLQDRLFEVQMKKDGTRWKVVGIKDEALADRIAQQVAEAIQKKLAEKGGATKSPNKATIDELKQQLEGIIGQ